jgi:intracellular sulfur oxidation DsrE/DsrF family protein
MKEKILAQLKAKFAGVPTVLLGLVAEKLSATVTEETAIEGAVADLEKSPISIQDYAKLLQTEGDRRATEAATTRENTLKEKFNLVAKTGNPDPGNPNPQPTPENETQVAILKLQKELELLKQKELSAAYRDKVVSALKEKGVNEKFFKNALTIAKFEKEEDISTFVDTVTASWTEFEQELTDQGLKAIPQPAFGNPTDTGISAAVNDYIQSKGTGKETNAGASPLGGKQL